MGTCLCAAHSPQGTPGNEEVESSAHGSPSQSRYLGRSFEVVKPHFFYPIVNCPSVPLPAGSGELAGRGLLFSTHPRFTGGVSFQPISKVTHKGLFPLGALSRPHPSARACSPRAQQSPELAMPGHGGRSHRGVTSSRPLCPCPARGPHECCLFACHGLSVPSSLPAR